jgi:hypothetical protein
MNWMIVENRRREEGIELTERIDDEWTRLFIWNNGKI